MGVSAYIGDGVNRWPAIHRADAARLFRLALEKAPSGSVLHGVGESAVLLEDLTTGDYFTAQASIRAEEIWLPVMPRVGDGRGDA